MNDDKIKKRIDLLSENFDLEEYLIRMKNKSKNIYDRAVAVVITKDKIIFRPSLDYHITAANEIYKKLDSNFTKFTDDYIDGKYLFWELEAKEKYSTVNMCLSYSKTFPMFIPKELNEFQLEQIKYIYNLCTKYSIEIETDIKNGEEEYVPLSNIIDKLDEMVAKSSKK